MRHTWFGEHSLGWWLKHPEPEVIEDEGAHRLVM